jgi:hypothetical protein
MLRKIQGASDKTNATESVKWYTIPAVTSMPAEDVTFNTIGFTGTLTANSTFTLYRDSEGTGAKSYNVYCKNLSGNYTLTLTTGVSGATDFAIKGGRNIVARILVDENGNIVSQSMTATDLIESGNNQPATSGGVFDEYKIIKYMNGGVNFNSLYPEGNNPIGGNNQKIYFVYGTSANLNTNAPNNLATTNFIVFATNGNGRVLQMAYEDQMNGDLVFIRTLDYNHSTWSPWKSLNNVYEITDADLVIPKVEKYGVCFAPNVRTNTPNRTSYGMWSITSFMSVYNDTYYINQIAQGYSSYHTSLYIREGNGASKDAITFTDWRKIDDSIFDDTELTLITDSVTKYLGIESVSAYRKGNMTYIYMTGTYTGSPTSSTQIFLSDLPTKYRPKINQSINVVSYNTVSPFVYPSRITVNANGTISLSETSMPTNTAIRMGFVYIVE